ncbi:MAG: hypothetical protein SF339_10290 [Blastocatellia bacterium]|nr:hypothetical protein [Blastocatellia bacterium]
MHARQVHNRRELVQQILAEHTTTAAKARPKETRLDIISAAVVVGMTAQFVSFILGLVTEFVPQVTHVTLVSVFVGVSVSLIAYALMKEPNDRGGRR